MSVVRAILGRFARFLVRIARTLDPAVAATPYWVMPERMAALRLRYPGAPEHWLELLARRTNLGDGAPAPAGRREPEARREAPQTHFGTAEPSRYATRPVPRFPSPFRKASVIARPGAADAKVRIGPEMPRAPTPSARPLLTFGLARVRNPIANLLRGKPPAERAAEPRFLFDDAAPSLDRAAQAPPTHRDQPREPLTIFPNVFRSAPHPDWIGGPRDSRQAADPPQPGWPEFRYSAPPGPSWPSQPSRQERYNPSFAAVDERWPELPPFFDESSTPALRASDEAALLAEQIGGTWSA